MDSAYITIDTEFLREHTYYPKLCLVQVATDTCAVLIDPLAQGISLDPLFEVLRAPSVLKVFHAARQDLEIFYRLMGQVPAPLFDTQVTGMVCGYGEQIGYDSLVNAITGKHIDKSSRLMDWSRRPLTDAQLKYALGDVTHLRDVYKTLASHLEDNGRTPWIAEEMDILCSASTYQVIPEKAYERIKVRTKNRRFMGILQDVAAWREVTAQNRDIPRNRLLRDESLQEIAAHPPKTGDDLEKVRGVPKGWGRSDLGKSLLEAVKHSLTRPEADLPALPKKKPNVALKGLQPLIELLKVLLKTRCEHADVAGKLVASAADIEEIARSQSDALVPAMSGWRYDIFGRDAVELCKGRIGLVYRNGHVIALNPDDDT